jgi:hypothetical protein
MKKTNSSIHMVCAGLALWFSLTACGLTNTTRVGELKSETQSVDLGSASTARVQLEFPAGELKVEGGAANLMDASFRFNVSDWQPEVTYSESGAHGELLVSQPGDDNLLVGEGLVNEWEIQLSENVPMDLVIRTSAGNSQLELGGLDLSSLTIETGTGVTNVNLDGAWQHDVNVTIRGSVVDLTVNLPAEMGARVGMETGLAGVTANGLIEDDNGYVNQAFGTAPYTLALKLETAAGSIDLVSP